MKRNLITQMKNEWRDNIWLVVELTIVFLIIWMVLIILYYKTEGLRYPRGFNPDNVYQLTVKAVNKESPYYVNDEDNDIYADYRELLRCLRENPNVEAVAFHWNVLPYNYDYSGNVLSLFDSQDSVEYYGNTRWASADVVDVLQITSMTGTSRERLKEKLLQGEILITDNEEYEQSRDPKDLIGKKVILGGNTENVYTVGDVVQNIRRTDYEKSWSGGMIVPLPESGQTWANVILRLKPGREEQFRNDLKMHPELRQLRNVYLCEFESLMNIREMVQKSEESDINIFLMIVMFLLFTIFFGLLGSFWFRIQQRIKEISIRKVCGATNGDIFRRIIGEGMILLLLSAFLAGGVGWIVYFTVEGIPFMDIPPIVVMESVTLLLLGIGIVISLWYPARRGMKIEPAIAIKDE